MPDAVFVIGATGRTGAALCRRLAEAGRPFVPVVRDAALWRELGLPGERRVLDLSETRSVAYTLEDARIVVSCAHASHTPTILEATGEATRYVLFGSTRRYSKWRDGHGLGVLAGEKGFLSSGRSGVMLHPTMIYGAATDQNVRRLAALLGRLPIVPLPGGGRALVQPIHQDDVTRAVMAALDIAWPGPRTMVIAGPEPMAYAEFARAVARAAGLRRPIIVPMPLPLLRLLARLAVLIPSLPHVDAGELRRLTEDKAFAIDGMINILGVRPISLAEGLARGFG